MACNAMGRHFDTAASDLEFAWNCSSRTVRDAFTKPFLPSVKGQPPLAAAFSRFYWHLEAVRVLELPEESNSEDGRRTSALRILLLVRTVVATTATTRRDFRNEFERFWNEKEVQSSRDAESTLLDREAPELPSPESWDKGSQDLFF